MIDAAAATATAAAAAGPDLSSLLSGLAEVPLLQTERAAVWLRFHIKNG